MNGTSQTALPKTPDSTGKQVEPFKAKSLLTWLLVILVAIGSGLLFRNHVGTLYYIPSQSMSPTLNGDTQNGDRVWVNKTAYQFGNEPKTGDIVVFAAPASWHAEETGLTLIKRVIATGGQTVALNDQGEVTVDGVALEEPYVQNQFEFKPGTLDCKTSPASQRCFPETTLKDGEVWVMGDNRRNSADSSYGCLGDTGTCQGPIKESDLIGQATQIVFPFSRFGRL